eukprot:5469082-Prymnesium_polylepis.1
MDSSRNYVPCVVAPRRCSSPRRAAAAAAGVTEAMWAGRGAAVAEATEVAPEAAAGARVLLEVGAGS